MSVSRGKRTKLLAPITEVVELDHLPAAGLVEVCEEGTNDGRTEVASMKGFGNVGGSELDDGFLSFARLIAAVGRLSMHVGQEEHSWSTQQKEVAHLGLEVGELVDLVERDRCQGGCLNGELHVDTRGRSC